MTDQLRILHWGCGHQWQLAPDSWVASDVEDYAQHHVGSVLDGLGFPDGHFDAVVHHHALQALDWHGLRPALRELARVVRPGGWMRFTVPDLVAGFDALGRDDRAWFPVNLEDEPTTAGAFGAWATWFGTNLTTFTRPWLAALLPECGWEQPTFSNGPTRGPIGFGVTVSPWTELTEADDRPVESIFVDCRRADP